MGSALLTPNDLESIRQAAAHNRRLRLASLCVCGIEESRCIAESQDDGDCSRHDERIENGVSPDTSDDGLTYSELRAGL